MNHYQKTGVLSDGAGYSRDFQDSMRDYSNQKSKPYPGISRRTAINGPDRIVETKTPPRGKTLKWYLYKGNKFHGLRELAMELGTHEQTAWESAKRGYYRGEKVEVVSK
jgi:hypothetical protein